MSRPAVPQVATNPALSRAVAGLGDYKKARSVAEQADALLAELVRTEVPRALDDLIADVLETGQVPADFGSDAARGRVDRAALVEREQMLRALADNARKAEESALELNVDAILNSLHEQLVEMLNEARNVAANLSGVTNAQSAIAAGTKAVKAWTAISALVPSHERIREAQSTVMHRFANDMARRARGGHSSTPTGSDAHLANLDEAWPGWRDRPAEGSHVPRETAGPWPEDPTELLAWLVSSDAQPWVPTRPQLTALWAGRTETDRQHPGEVRGMPLAEAQRQQQDHKLDFGAMARMMQ